MRGDRMAAQLMTDEIRKKRGRPKKAQAPPSQRVPPLGFPETSGNRIEPQQATWFEEIAPRIVISKDDDVPDWVKS